MTTIHWKAPAVMLGSLLAGTVVAIAHHYFYKALNGQVPSTGVFDQQVNVGIGTALAFLTRSLLVIAIGVAYTQLFFNTILQKATSVSSIDVMYGARGSVIDLLNLSTFWKRPMIWALALLSWTVPIATIVPPSTLSVHIAPSPATSTTIASIPLLNFTSVPFFAQTVEALPLELAPDGTEETMQAYAGPESSLTSMLQRVSSSGVIVDLPHPVTNSNFSYTISFEGPALECNNATGDIFEAFQAGLGCRPGSIANRYLYDGDTCGLNSQMPIYEAWTPTADAYMPWVPNNTSILAAPADFANQPMSIFIAWADADFHILNCSLWSAIYTTTFNYTSGVQAVQTNMSNLLPGPHNLTSVTWLVSAPPMSVKDMNHVTMMQAFSGLLLGEITFQDDEGVQASSNTSVITTALAWLTDIWQVTAAYAQTNGNVAPRPEQIPNIPVNAAIEELFQNFTISLLSDPTITNNTYSPPTPISIYSTTTQYVYSPFRLVLAYSLALAATAAAVLSGLISMITHHRTFSTQFSTIMRLTRGATIDQLVGEAARDGAEPLPERIGKAKLRFGEEVEQVELVKHGAVEIRKRRAGDLEGDEEVRGLRWQDADADELEHTGHADMD